jgi:MFS family permease
VARIPAIKAQLHLSDGVLGVTLLWSAIGAMCSIPVTGLLLARWGPRIICTISTVLFCLGLILPGYAPNAVLLAASLFFFGGMAAAMDVSMNAHGVMVEKKLGYPTMSRFHACFSAGGMAGAGLGGTIAAHHIGPAAHFVASGVFYSAVAIGLRGMLLAENRPPGHSEHRLPLKQIPAVLFAVSAIGFCILLSEGAVADWTAVYLRQNLLAGPGVAAAGYSVFSAAMAIFRFAGDWITARLGAARMVLAGTLLAATGMGWAILATNAFWALPGFAIIGAGLSSIIPLVFGSGGRIKGINPAAGIATVTGLGYIGFIVGPPTIGFLAEWVTLRGALGFVVLCCLVSAVLSTTLKTLGDSGERSPSSPDIQPHV